MKLIDVTNKYEIIEFLKQVEIHFLIHNIEDIKQKAEGFGIDIWERLYKTLYSLCSGIINREEANLRFDKLLEDDFEEQFEEQPKKSDIIKNIKTKKTKK